MQSFRIHTSYNVWRDLVYKCHLLNTMSLSWMQYCIIYIYITFKAYQWRTLKLRYSKLHLNFSMRFWLLLDTDFISDANFICIKLPLQKFWHPNSYCHFVYQDFISLSIIWRLGGVYLMTSSGKPQATKHHFPYCFLSIQLNVQTVESLYE